MSCLPPLSEPWKSARFGAWGSYRLPGGSHSTLLSSQLRKEYGANVVPAFPPKKIFTLTPAEVEQRREQLEKYMQAGKLGLPHVYCGSGPASLARRLRAWWRCLDRSLWSPGSGFGLFLPTVLSMLLPVLMFAAVQ